LGAYRKALPETMPRFPSPGHNRRCRQIEHAEPEGRVRTTTIVMPEPNF
jgi:hypothetical protein